VRPRTSVLALITMLAGCSATTADIGTLGGEWHGRVVTADGATVARLTIAPDGRYEGMAFFEGVDRPLHGAIVALPSGQLRYAITAGRAASFAVQ
jgi:hypothetical protein